jgi:uncharacterized protein (UPF0332 family)
VSIEKLEREGIIRQLPADSRRVEEAFALAARDLSVAGSVLAVNPDWAYAIAYNAMLQAARALLFADGFRPAGKNQHVAVVRFVAVRIGPDEAAVLDRLRRKRHITVYDTAGTIGEAEAEAAVSRATAFAGLVRGLLDAEPNRHNP